MRPIKFRGKRIDNGKWIFGDLIQDSKGAVAIWPIASVNSDGMEEVHPSSIGQFTGLHDRNGKEIYEGDILKRYNKQGKTMHVNWFGPQFGCVQHWDGVDGEGSWYPLDNYDMCQWEIVGNIHDNPELIDIASKGMMEKGGGK